jgi:ligand-binding sensor domain-containing protein/signal transduction histidine kinase
MRRAPQGGRDIALRRFHLIKPLYSRPVLPNNSRMRTTRWIGIAGIVLGGLLPGDAAVPVAEPFADSAYVVEAIPVEGLPQSSVISIVQSHEGYLWLGTLGGLARFDGTRFTDFGEADLPGLNSSRIVCLFADSRSNLWVGTEGGGILSINPNGAVTSLRSEQNSPGARLVSACEDSTGIVWLNTVNGELLRYQSNKLDAEPGRFERIAADKSGLLWVLPWGPGGSDTNLYGITAVPGSGAIVVREGVSVGKLNFLLASPSGGFWRIAEGRVQKWKAGRLERDVSDASGTYPWDPTNIVTSACEDRDGNLIIGTLGAGVFWYDTAGKPPTHISEADGSSLNYVASLCLDRDGNLWVGTDGAGLYRVRRKHFRVLQGSQKLTIQSVCEDREGGVWFATFYYGKLGHWKNGLLQEYGDADGLRDPNLRSVFVDRDHGVWVGTTIGGLFQLQSNRFQLVLGQSNSINPSVSVLYQDRAGNVWAGTQRGLAVWDGRKWKLFTTSDGLSANDVRAIAEDAQGNLWIGTELGGLNRWRDGKFTAFRKSDQGLPSDNVWALCVDSDGVLWVGTSAGLARWQQDRWTRYTTRDGLATDGIGSLIDDDEGSLWIGSYVGLLRVSKKSLNEIARGQSNSVVCRVYGKPDGLPTRECALGSQPAACRTSDGRLWFATTKGLVTVNPSELKPNPYLPPVKIESVRVGGYEQNTNEFSGKGVSAVVMRPGQELLEIRYTSLNPGAGERSRFKCFLENHEPGFIDVGGTREVRYSNLRPGLYHFRVKACNEDGVWNEVAASLAVRVLPPFWQTWWFLTLTVLAMIGAIVTVVHYLSTQKLQRELAALRQQEALEQERGRIARDLHDQLGGNLMQVALLGELAESDKDLPAEVEEHARQISQTARETTRALDEIVWAANPSNDTLESLITYVCKYAQEYFELAALSYRLDVPPRLPDVTLPPEVRHNVFLAAKEAVNNVVKHARASTARMRLKLEPERFTLEIEDDGRGLDPAAASSDRNGLRNMRRRMADIGGEFSIGPAPERGTVVRLSAPMTAR